MSSHVMQQPQRVCAAICIGLLLAGVVTGALADPRKAAASEAADSGLAALHSEIRHIAGPIGGKFGVAAWRLDGKGKPVLFNADEAFPMGSTFKVAVAGSVLAKIDRRKLALEQLIPIRPDQMIVSDIIADRFIHPGLSVSIHNLLELMLTESDNTATDVLMAEVGGPATVTTWVRSQGVEELRVDDATDGIVRRFYGMSREGSFPEAFADLQKNDPEFDERSLQPNPAFDDDPRDTTTPKAMGELLDRIFSGKALTPESTSILIAIMERCRTGEGRLRGKMPADTTIAHKTGTIGGTVNDVGVISLPDGAGKVMIAVFIKKSAAPYEDRERAIAEIARSIRDYYLFGG